MADLGLVENTEVSEQLVGTVEPMALTIDELEPSIGVGLQEAAYTNVGEITDFENVRIEVIADTAPTVIQVNSLITNMITANSYITDLIKVSSEIQEEN
jgi:hypothetical protein